MLFAFILSSLLQIAAAQSPSGSATTASAEASSTTGSASSYIQPDVPTGTPVPGNYGGALRPQVHFSPPAGFMNDPNGMFVDANGTWHLYYQYNPTAAVPGNQHWGHATSRDLYHWENQQIALFPPNNYTFVYSGSAVVDANNTSGFFPNQTNGVVAVYTLAESFPDRAGPQQQAIAYSLDGGFTFIPYEGNPVIPSNSSQFRDPKVIWYKDHWVMVVAYSQDFAIGIFTSPNLKNWTATSNFSYHGLLGEQYECPNLVSVPVNGTNGGTKFVLTISINPGAPLGGSVTQYFIGDFNGTHFVAMDGATRLTDFAKDNYAGQFFYGVGAPNSDAVSMAWASNWQYTALVPTAQEGWAGTMSLPRRNYLANTTRTGLSLYQEPYGLDSIRGSELASNASLGNGTVVADFQGVPSRAVVLEANVTGIDTSTVSASATLNFTFFSPATGESLRGGFFFAGDNPFFIDRGNTDGFENVFFTDKFSTASPLGDASTWSMSAVIDQSIFEVFVNGGASAATVSFYPTQPLTSLAVSAVDIQDSMRVSVGVYALDSAWMGYADEQGNVLGNVTNGSANSAPTAKRHMIYEARF
ncbi:uncharacterized protein PV09_02581 [Verruconis gallopava]|uniref:Glycosyl hydrolase family 32 N-terminal domain-containing protein n=1 Tax=Verruconis gallopava TaxID=253628 RepID=A0A0D1Z1V5_9PEZI|nr:uncharacterized protein PV09_02581 [Verruconis gallopava]KIW06912.1 hypothetical protein PV09_02581 [Verruconis gallopava]